MKIVNIVQTCPACPSQWDAETEDGRPVYICYRWGTLWVRVGPKGSGHEDLGDWQVVLEKRIGEPLDGFITLEKIQPLIEEIVL